MPITSQYDKDQNIIRSTASAGVLTLEELLEYLNTVVEDQRIIKDFIEIFDFNGVTDIVIAYSDTDPFRSIWSKYIGKGCKASIVHAPTDLSYGIARMIRTVIGFVHGEIEDKFVIVRSNDELESVLHDLG